MKIIDLKLTYRCNNDCRYCCQDRRLRAAETDFHSSDVERILDSEIPHGIDKVVLTGGEPTMNKELESIAQCTKERGIRTIQLQTNARRLKDSAFLGRLISSGVNCFGISLHGHNAEVHEAFTGGNGSFCDLVEALENLKQYNLPVSLNCVITRHNVRYLKDILFFARQMCANAIQFAFIHITGKAENGTSDFVSITDAASAVKTAVDDAAQDGTLGSIKVTTEAIPPCLMKGHERMVSELFNDAEIITYDYTGRREFSHSMPLELKSKGPLCSGCICSSVCEGTWAEYPRLYGFGEFVPVTRWEARAAR